MHGPQERGTPRKQSLDKLVDITMDIPMDMARPSATVEVAQEKVEVPRVIPHERMLRWRIVRERTRQTLRDAHGGC